METKQNKGGKIFLYCFLVIAAILGIIAFILSLTKKCGEGFYANSHNYELTEQEKLLINDLKKVKTYGDIVEIYAKHMNKDQKDVMKLLFIDNSMVNKSLTEDDKKFFQDSTSEPFLFHFDRSGNIRRTARVLCWTANCKNFPFNGVYEHCRVWPYTKIKKCFDNLEGAPPSVKCSKCAHTIH